ncbi:MAG: tyrosine-type recombinase/integrase [Candidatus Aenigmatarchaeota archaeon]
MSIHNVGYRIENAVKRIKNNSQISESNRELILKYQDQLFAEGLSKSRVLFYLNRLYKSAEYIDCDFEKADKQNIKSLVTKIEKKDDYSPKTKNDYKVSIKKFYRWLENEDDDEYPDKVKWINTTLKKKSQKLPEEILTQDDIRKLIQEAGTPRDKAIISVLYESGTRIGELLSLKIKHVTFDKHGAKLIVKGKTGMRRIRLISSVKYLTTYLETHPKEDEPESPLWVTMSANNQGNELGYRRVRNLLREIAKKAGVKKRVNPHMFRHSRATHLANHLTEAQMNHMFGWVQGSDQPATYVHLSGKDVDNALLKMHGFKPDNDENKETLTCPRCNVENKSSAKFCTECGQPLDLKSSMDLEDKKKEADEELQTFLIALKRVIQKEPDLKEKIANVLVEK